MITALLFVGGLTFLYLGGEGLVRGASAIGLQLGMLAYVALTLWRTKTRRSGETLEASSVPLLTRNVAANVLVGLGGAGLLMLGSDWLVVASVDIATSIGVSTAVIGLSAAALGTSLPEIAASVVAAHHGHAEMAAGNLVGSNIFNLLLVLGATAMVTPLSRDAVGYLDMGIMVAASLASLGLMAMRTRVGRRDGIALIAVYVAYIVWIFIVNHGPAAWSCLPCRARLR